MTRQTAEELIKQLDLVRHPEGGWYRETYRAIETIHTTALPERFAGDRSFCTAIYFLLEKGDVSTFHRINSDELWHFHAGASLTIHMLSPAGEHLTLRLGADLAAGASYQAVVPAGYWFRRRGICPRQLHGGPGFRLCRLRDGRQGKPAAAVPSTW